MPDRHDAPELGRREFLKRVGTAGIAVSLVGIDALAQTGSAPAPPAPPAPATPAPTKPDSLGAAAPPAISADALALAEILKRRFPDRLSAEQWEGVTRSLDQRLDSGRRLRAARLANGDEPDFSFRP
jgi:hypothetical protein